MKILTPNNRIKTWSDILGDADTVDGFHAAATATANKLLALDANAEFPAHKVNSDLTLTIASGNPKLVLDTNGTARFAIGVNASDANKFQVCAGSAIGTTPRLTIDGNGNVGIGTTSPSSLVHIKTRSASESEALRLEDGGGGVTALCLNTVYGSGYQARIMVVVDWSNAFRVYIGNTQIIQSYNDGSLVAFPAGSIWIANNCSALSFTDRTPYFRGDALAAIRRIRGDERGIDHSSLPDFVRKQVRGPDGEFGDGRDLGAMVTLLTVAVQQLLERVERLEGNRA